MPFRIGPMELIIVLVIVLIIFGAGRLPEVGGAMGRAIREFRRGQSGKPESSDVAEVEEKRKTST